MEAVTSDDVQRAAQRVFVPERLIVAASGALSDKQRAKVEKTVKTWR
jgi:predicted Zn-dependent peptidase